MRDAAPLHTWLTMPMEPAARAIIDRQMGEVWFDPRLADSLRDESPKSYKDVRAVLRAQEELVKIERTLKPVLVYKGAG